MVNTINETTNVIHNILQPQQVISTVFVSQTQQTTIYEPRQVSTKLQITNNIQHNKRLCIFKSTRLDVQIICTKTCPYRAVDLKGRCRSNTFIAGMIG